MDIKNEIMRVIEIEINELENLKNSIDDNYEKAINALHYTIGKIIVTGIGKSGHIAKKIAATLASTGTPAFFVHSLEALHGDLGMIELYDSVIAISNSGESLEVINMLKVLQERKITTIGISRDDNSSLAKLCDFHLKIQISKEADINNLAPSSSTTCTLAIGDALAFCLSGLKSFTDKDFALHHPGGTLGKMLSENDNK